MLDAAFWLARAGDSEAPILDPAGVAAFNAGVRRAMAAPAVTDLPDTLDGEAVRAVISPRPETVYYDVTGALLSDAVWQAIEANIGAVPDRVTPRFGLATRRCDLRSFPTASPALREPGQLAFDRFQETAIDVGWPVAAVHTSADGAWFFVRTPLNWGWLPAGCIAFAGRDTVQAFTAAEPFVVATASRAGVAMADGAHALAQMGTRLPLAGRDDGALRVSVPRRDPAGGLALVEGYVAVDDDAWHEGYMPYTLRTVFERAFSLLGEGYAWGGSRVGIFGRDCSRLVKDVWATAGVLLPRNSGEQGRVGVTAARFEPGDSPPRRAEILASQAPLGALLILPGHVMLYLGRVEGVPYAIHDLWGYTHPGGGVTYARSVVVSDLPVEPGGEKPTIMERLTHVQAVGLPV
jgi:hypothetical protein